MITTLISASANLDTNLKMASVSLNVLGTKSGSTANANAETDGKTLTEDVLSQPGDAQ